MTLNGMLNRLNRIRDDISLAQNQKLIQKWEEHGDYRSWPLSTIADRVIEEMEELKEAIQTKGPDDIKDEIYDVRSTTEMLWDKLGLKS